MFLMAQGNDPFLSHAHHTGFWEQYNGKHTTIAKHMQRHGDQDHIDISHLIKYSKPGDYRIVFDPGHGEWLPAVSMLTHHAGKVRESRIPVSPERAKILMQRLDK